MLTQKGKIKILTTLIIIHPYSNNYCKKYSCALWLKSKDIKNNYMKFVSGFGNTYPVLSYSFLYNWYSGVFIADILQVKLRSWIILWRHRNNKTIKMNGNKKVIWKKKPVITGSFNDTCFQLKKRYWRLSKYFSNKIT